MHAYIVPSIFKYWMSSCTFFPYEIVMLAEWTFKEHFVLLTSKPNQESARQRVEGEVGIDYHFMLLNLLLEFQVCVVMRKEP